MEYNTRYTDDSGSAFRAFALAFSVFNPKENSHHQRVRRKYGIAAKCVAALFPGLIVGLLQIPAVQCSVPLFITIADFSCELGLKIWEFFFFFRDS